MFGDLHQRARYWTCIGAVPGARFCLYLGKYSTWSYKLDIYMQVQGIVHKEVGAVPEQGTEHIGVVTVLKASYFM